MRSDGLEKRMMLALYCIVFIHFYSASHSLSLSEALPTTAMRRGKEEERATKEKMDG